MGLGPSMGIRLDQRRTEMHEEMTKRERSKGTSEERDPGEEGGWPESIRPSRSPAILTSHAPALAHLFFPPALPPPQSWLE